MTFQDMLHDLRVRGAEEREKLELEIERVSKDHDDSVLALERWAAIPEEKSEEQEPDLPRQPRAQTIQRIVQSALASRGLEAPGEMIIVGQGFGGLIPPVEPGTSVEDVEPAPPVEGENEEDGEYVEEEGTDTETEDEEADDDMGVEDTEEENVRDPTQSRIDVMTQHQVSVNRTTLRSMIQRHETLRTESLEKKQELEKKIEKKRLESAELEGKLKTIEEDFHDQECSVCYASKAEVLTKCLHAFCAKCMWKIFIRKNMAAPCPYCKQNVAPTDVYFIVNNRVHPQIPIYSKYKMIAYYADEYAYQNECRCLAIVKDPYSFYSSFQYLNLRNQILIWDPRFADTAANVFSELSLNDSPRVIVTSVNNVDFLPRIQNLQYVLCDHYISANSHKFSYLRQYNPETKRLPRYVSFIQDQCKESTLIPRNESDEDC